MPRVRSPVHRLCLKKTGHPFAQCRNPADLFENNYPYATWWALGECVQSAQWECPGWENSPPPPPSPPLPPPPPAKPAPQAPVLECAPPWHACWGFASPPPTPPPSPEPPVTMFGRRLGGNGTGEGMGRESKPSEVDDGGWRDGEQMSWRSEGAVIDHGGSSSSDRRGLEIAFNKNIAGLQRCCQPDEHGNLFGCYRRTGLLVCYRRG